MFNLGSVLFCLLSASLGSWLRNLALAVDAVGLDASTQIPTDRNDGTGNNLKLFANLLFHSTSAIGRVSTAAFSTPKVGHRRSGLRFHCGRMSINGTAEKSSIFTAEADGSIIINAPQSLVFAAYDNIERMPEWSPILRSVKFVDKQGRRSKWLLKVPQVMLRFARFAGFDQVLNWEAIHEVEKPGRLWWRSISGFPNRGEILFEAVDGHPSMTNVTMKMLYEIPWFASPLVENMFVRRFMRSNVRRTMELFRDKMEEEANEYSSEGVREKKDLLEVS